MIEVKKELLRDGFIVYGEKDKVVPETIHNDFSKNWPTKITEAEIEGANHSVFIMNDLQEGDSESSISNIERINIIPYEIYYFISE